MIPSEFERGTPFRVRGVDVRFSTQDINMYYSTRNYRGLDTGVLPLHIFVRYNAELVRELRLPYVEGGTLEKRQSALERGVADLRRAIQDSRMSAFEHHNGAGPSTKPVTVPEQQSYHGHIHAIFYERQHLSSHQLED
ncbi:hypothetical protein QYF36_018602 [Acer negundo]|nr:hypothetical protein QYF36_018602 [Acer negundo]